jgi:hypothetical protein
MAAVCAKAFIDFDNAWDSVAYHLPFAALKTGLVTPQQYQLTGTLQHYYDGFPSPPSYLRGWLWILFRRPEATNLLSLASFCCLVLYVWKIFRIPVGWVTIALLAIPVVQVSVTRSQIDLPANVFMTIVVLSICDWVLRPEDFTRLKVLIAVGAAALAANFKPQMVLQVLVALCVVGMLGVVSMRRGWQSSMTTAIRARPFRSVLAFSLACCVVFATPLANWYRFQNPFYPIAVRVGTRDLFAGPMPPGGLWPEPVYSATWPQAFRWLLSVLEFRAFDFRPIPYTLGNGDVPVGAMSMRVGGYMGLAVLFSLWLFVVAARSRRDRMAVTFSVALLVVTGTSAIVPGSHELRYASFWMIFLVVATVIMLDGKTPPLSDWSRAYKAFLLATLVYVICITGGQHVWPQGTDLKHFLKAYRIDQRLTATVHGGETVCLADDPQAAFFFAPIFHRAFAVAHPYSVRVEGFTPGGRNYMSSGSGVCTWLPR